MSNVQIEVRPVEAYQRPRVPEYSPPAQMVEVPSTLLLADGIPWDAKALRAEFMEEYGSACACCGETEIIFLTVDHVNNDGAAERRLYGGTTAVLRMIKTWGWPKDRYRILCYNCNSGRARNGGLCPHEVGDR